MYNKMNWSGIFLHSVKFRFQKSTNLAKCRRSHFNVLSEKVTPLSHTNDEVSNGDFASVNRVKFNAKRLKTAQTVFVENWGKSHRACFKIMNRKYRRTANSNGMSYLESESLLTIIIRFFIFVVGRATVFVWNVESERASFDALNGSARK